MALDGLVIHSLVDELSTKLIGGKIDKIYQPEEDEILLSIRSNKENYKLLLSASASNPRIYITQKYKKENPMSAPMFCMILRKYLLNGKILNISQPEFERIIKITVESLDELKIKATKDIIIEIMGRHSNIIVVHNETNKIIDSIKRVPISISRQRQVLPGQDYNYPPSQNKLNPLNNITKETFINTITSTNSTLHKSIYTSFLGISPVIAKEICYRSNLDESININDLNASQLENFYNVFIRTFNQINNNIYSPCIVINKKIDKIIDFSSIKLTMYNEYSYIENESISNILENYYLSKDARERINQRTQNLRKSISTKLDRLYNKLKKQQEELNESENAHIYKIKGELITSYIYMINKGMEFVDVVNFYDPEGGTIKISLNKNLTPSENAQRYFKKYNKLKHAKKEITIQMDITNEEVNYLENILLSIENCENLAEIQEIRDELIKTGYIKSKVKNKKDKKDKKDSNVSTTKPYEFISSDGFKIFVGKNNKQNDYLTLKMASNDDIWMHTKNIPGSHVIIKSEGKEIPENTIKEGAILSAYYSKARMSSKVPVDYTIRKNIKKPNGAKPGMVIYETNSTIYVNPSEEEVVKLKIR